jgi:hypothetical protein
MNLTFSGKAMSTHPKKSNKSKSSLFLAIVVILGSTIIVSGSAVFGFSILWKECSRLIENIPIAYPSSWNTNN